MRDILVRILEQSSSREACDWLKSVLAAPVGDASGGFPLRSFYYAFSGVSRHFDKKPGLDIGARDLEALQAVSPDLPIHLWDQYRLARVILLLSLGEQPGPVFLKALLALLGTADIRENVAIFSAYPWLPFHEEMVEPAVDTLRTNIVDIFDAIALDNPFPARHFSEAAWNQMVLKSIFLNRPLYRITGVEARSNQALAGSISGLAHERWAAGRTLDPAAWLFTADHASDGLVSDWQRLLDSGSAADKEAVALIIADRHDVRWDSWRSLLVEPFGRVRSGSLTWSTLGSQS